MLKKAERRDQEQVCAQAQPPSPQLHMTGVGIRGLWELRDLGRVSEKHGLRWGFMLGSEHTAQGGEEAKHRCGLGLPI